MAKHIARRRPSRRRLKTIARVVGAIANGRARLKGTLANGDKIDRERVLANDVSPVSGLPVARMKWVEETAIVVVNPQTFIVAEVKDTSRARREFARVCDKLGIETEETESGTLATTSYVLHGKNASELHSGGLWRVYAVRALPTGQWGKIGPERKPARSRPSKGTLGCEATLPDAPIADCTVVAPHDAPLPMFGPFLPLVHAVKLAYTLDSSLQSQGSGI